MRRPSHARILPFHPPRHRRRDSDSALPADTVRLVDRHGYHIRDYQITPDGSCPTCATQVPGRWSEQFGGQIASHPFLPRGRRLAVFGP